MVSKFKKKSFWTKQFYLWHWVSSAICLMTMLLFAITGITLNHAGKITAKPAKIEKTAELSPNLLAEIKVDDDEDSEFKKALPGPIRQWISNQFDVTTGGRAYEWSDIDIYIDLPTPGGDAWMSIDRETGEVIYEKTTRGLIAYANDLHKGRNTGREWVWFMDIFSGASIIFCLTGLALLWVHSKRRPSTWPIVAAGLLIPFIIIFFFVH
ncbi:MAG: PepSY-associated TM helix domain-containing protein [Verrucomicrobiales bacterium]|nr:PepSY-associated TM helix domain-containing protein [Verrucomicrobiales bacterium]